MRFVITHKMRCLLLVRYDRIWALVEGTGKAKSYLSRKMGHSERYLIDARKQNTNIKPKELQILAEELGTTVAYIVGESDDAKAKKETITESDGFTAKQAKGIELIKSLSEDELDRAMAALEAFFKK